MSMARSTPAQNPLGWARITRMPWPPDGPSVAPCPARPEALIAIRTGAVHAKNPELAVISHDDAVAPARRAAHPPFARGPRRRRGAPDRTGRGCPVASRRRRGGAAERGHRAVLRGAAPVDAECRDARLQRPLREPRPGAEGQLRPSLHGARIGRPVL